MQSEQLGFWVTSKDVSKLRLRVKVAAGRWPVPTVGCFLLLTDSLPQQLTTPITFSYFFPQVSLMALSRQHMRSNDSHAEMGLTPRTLRPKSNLWGWGDKVLRKQLTTLKYFLVLPVAHASTVGFSSALLSVIWIRENSTYEAHIWDPLARSDAGEAWGTPPPFSRIPVWLRRVDFRLLF